MRKLIFFASGPLAGASLYNRLRSPLKSASVSILSACKCLSLFILSCVFIFRLLAIVYATLFLLKIELHHVINNFGAVRVHVVRHATVQTNIWLQVGTLSHNDQQHHGCF